MRDEIFRSGMPLMIAGVCFLTLAYLTRVRGERFLAYWTAAWALLMMRYVWNMIWGTPWPNTWSLEVSGMLRTGFALSVLAGSLELRGRQTPWTWVAIGAILFPLFTSFIAWGLPGVEANYLNLAAMTVLTLLAGWHLARAGGLPRAERLVTAGALALYGVLSGILPLMSDGTDLFRFLLMATQGLQLVVGVSMIAMYFRASYEVELQRQRKEGENLTEVLSGYLSICMHCKAIRDEQQQWQKLESYVERRSRTVFSHGLCDSCATTHYEVDQQEPDFTRAH